MLFIINVITVFVYYILIFPIITFSENSASYASTSRMVNIVCHPTLLQDKNRQSHCKLDNKAPTIEPDKKQKYIYFCTALS